MQAVPSVDWMGVVIFGVLILVLTATVIVRVIQLKKKKD